MKYQSLWDLSPLFSSDTDPAIESSCKSAGKQADKFVATWLNRSDYLEDPSVLATALAEYEKLLRLYGTTGAAGYYFWLRSAQDQTNTDIKARLAKVQDSGTKIENKIQFFTLRLAKLSPSKQKEFLAHRDLYPYRHFLKRIFARSAYMLSEPEEKILNLAADPAYSKWTQMLATFLSKEERTTVTEEGKREKQTIEELTSLMTSSQKKVRDSAAAAMHDILRANAGIAEAEINAVLATKKIDDELRGAKRPDAMRHLSDDIDSDIVDTLTRVVSKHFSLPERFYKLKAKLLGVKKLAYHERNVEYGKLDKKYPFHEAVLLVRNVFQRLDPEFASILLRYIDHGQIDVYPRKGKRGGAFCAHELMTQPTYILLNYTDKLRDITTLAHEMGHGINNELIKQKQHALYFGTPMATAEVASTFMEDFVLQELVRISDEETQFAILITKLSDDISTIFRQVACYQFEQELHKQFREKGYLSHQEIGQLFQKHMRSYMGRYVEQSEGSENWWVHWHHIRSYFYVYSYASGLLISKSLQQSVKENPKFIEKVKDFLSAGRSDSPENIFMKMGIRIRDSAFWETGIAEIEGDMLQAEKLAERLGLAKRI